MFHLLSSLILFLWYMNLMNNGEMDRGNENPPQHLPWWLRKTTKKAPSGWSAPGFWTRDLPNASLVRYHGATSLGFVSLVFLRKGEIRLIKNLFLFSIYNFIRGSIKQNLKPVWFYLLNILWITTCKDISMVRWMSSGMCFPVRFILNTNFLYVFLEILLKNYCISR